MFDKFDEGVCIENGCLLWLTGSVGGAEAVGGGLINIDVDVGGGGAIGGFIRGSLSFTVSLTLAAKVCDTTVVADTVLVGTPLLAGPLPDDIIMALV